MTTSSDPTSRPAAPPSGAVHWLGAGRSTGAGLRTLSASARSVTLWGRDLGRVADTAERVGVASSACLRRLEAEALSAELRPGDVVVSMLPADQHAAVLDVALDRGAHFVCSSYLSDELARRAAQAAAKGLVILTEAGLDPGLDHLFALDLLSRAPFRHERAQLSLTSYCGGLTAVPNDFRYKFSWAPLGVLRALRTPVRFIEGGGTRTADRPWTEVVNVTIGDEEFEALPNRDSTRYPGLYGVPDGWSVQNFVRGTLRYNGWKNAWRDVFPVIERGSDEDLAALADDLCVENDMGEREKDRVVLDVSVVLRADGEPIWRGRRTLDLVGTESATAMSTCVSETVACGVRSILRGALPAGLSVCPEIREATAWLDELEVRGIPIQDLVEPR